MKHWWIMSLWHIALLEQLIYLAYTRPCLCHFLPARPPPPGLRHRFVNTFPITKKCSFIFTSWESHTEGLCSSHRLPSLFRMLWDGQVQLLPSEQVLCTCRSSRPTRSVATLHWEPLVRLLHHSYLASQACHCHLPWNRDMIALSREIETPLWKKMQLLFYQKAWRKLGFKDAFYWEKCPV